MPGEATLQVIHLLEEFGTDGSNALDNGVRARSRQPRRQENRLIRNGAPKTTSAHRARIAGGGGLAVDRGCQPLLDTCGHRRMSAGGDGVPHRPLGIAKALGLAGRTSGVQLRCFCCRPPLAAPRRRGRADQLLKGAIERGL